MCSNFTLGRNNLHPLQSNSLLLQVIGHLTHTKSFCFLYFGHSRRALLASRVWCSPASIRSFCNQLVKRLIHPWKAPVFSPLPVPLSNPRVQNPSFVLEKKVRLFERRDFNNQAQWLVIREAKIFNGQKSKMGERKIEKVVKDCKMDNKEFDSRFCLWLLRPKEKKT